VSRTAHRHLRPRPSLASLTIILVHLAPLVATAYGARAAPPEPSESEDFVRFTLEPPAASPYHTIRYEITRRAPATTAVHRRQLPGLEEGLHALGLLTPEESRDFFALARGLDAASLRSVPRTSATPPGALTWRCDLLLDGKVASFIVTDPDNLVDRRYARLLAAVQRTVLEHAGELRFRNVFFPAHDRGWLNVESVPAAALTLDGFDTKLETPLYSYEVAAGTHEIVLRSLDGRLVRTFQVRVEPQGTTTLRIDLR